MDEIEETLLKMCVREDEVKDPAEYVRLLKVAMAEDTFEAWEAVRAQFLKPSILAQKA